MHYLDLFRMLFADKEGYICLAFRGDIHSKPIQSFFYWSDSPGQDDTELIKQWVEEHKSKDCYFCPHLLSEPIRQKQYALPGDILYADLDECHPDRLGKYGEPTPSAIVQTSSNRWQAYWLVALEIEPEEYEALNHRIALGYKNEGCDQSGWDLTQLLRIPDTINNKGKRFMVKAKPLMSDDEVAPDPIEFEVLPQVPRQGSTAAVTFSETLPPINVEQQMVSSTIKDLINEGWTEGCGYPSRSEADQAVITALLSAGCSNDEIKAVFSQYRIGTNGKYAEEGDRYLEHSIRNAIAYLASKEGPKWANFKQTMREKGYSIEERGKRYLEILTGNFCFRCHHFKMSKDEAITHLVIEREGQALYSNEGICLGKQQNRAQAVNALRAKGIETLNMDEYLMETNHIIRKRLEIEKEETVETKEVSTALDEEAAKMLLTSPRILFKALHTIKQLGVVGEEALALLYYLTLTSRLLKRPISVIIKGLSSSGKSYVLLRVLILFPRTAYLDLTDATPQSFVYSDEKDFDHKILIMLELPGMEKANYSIRTLQSEGKLAINTTIRDPETNRYLTERKEINATVGFITTTIQQRINAENETRLLSVYTDESTEQTDRILELQAKQVAGLIPEVSNEELESWRNAQMGLETHDVIIPYAERIWEAFPKDAVRGRRDFPQLLAIIQASALLHQYLRERKGEAVVANACDYHIATQVAGKMLGETIYELPPKTKRAIEVCRELGDTFTVPDIMTKLSWAHSTVDACLKPAIEKGFITAVEAARGKVAAKYKVTSKELDAAFLLPTVDELFPEGWQDDVYDPITGQEIRPGDIGARPTPQPREESKEERAIRQIEMIKKETKAEELKRLGCG